MLAVVNDPQGTGTAAQIPGVAVAGKTGTAETGPGETAARVVHRVRARRPPEVRGRGARRARRIAISAEVDRRARRRADREASAPDVAEHAADLRRRAVEQPGSPSNGR